MIGIIGSGQLGMMICESEQSNRIKVFSNTKDSPCSKILTEKQHVIGDYQNTDNLIKFAQSAKFATITYELENIDVKGLLHIHEQLGIQVIPNPKILQMIQDKCTQKLWYQQHDIPTSPFITIQSSSSMITNKQIPTSETGKFVIKRSHGGYDGRGVEIVNVDQLKNMIVKDGESFLIEPFIDCEMELSVIVAIDVHGKVVSYPTVEQVFNPTTNQLDYLICPLKSIELDAKAQILARKVVESFSDLVVDTEAIAKFARTKVKASAASAANTRITKHCVGVYAVEMFVDRATGQLLVNEVAPRPHNSGHHTIEACNVSQFEQLLRICQGLPVQQPVMKNCGAAAIINIVGVDPSRIEKKLSKGARTYIHDYGKTDVRPNRKMGHVTILGDCRENVLKQLNIFKVQFY